MANGPARGLYQMEMATHDEIWNNYLAFRKPLADKVLQFKTAHDADPEHELINNDQYGTAMARVHYARIREAIPESGDRIRNQNDNNAAPLILTVDTTQYMKRFEDGPYRLSYCNVFVDKVILK